MASTALRRRADLSGAFLIMAVLERSIGVVAADASGPMKESVRAVGIDMRLDPRFDEMGPHRAFGDLQFQRSVGDAIVVSDLPLLLDAQDLVEVDAGNGGEGRALAGRIDGEAGVVGWQIDLAQAGVGRLVSVMPASLSSFTSRSCSVPNIRSERPRAWGEKAPIGSIPSCSSARPTWVG
jgi:hypothetical protein